MKKQKKEEISIGFLETRQTLIMLIDQLEQEISNLMIKQRLLKEILLNQDLQEFEPKK